MTKKYSVSDKTPSEIFVDSLPGGGSHYMTCGYCGRDHYCPDSSSIYRGDDEDDKGDYEYYLQEALWAQKEDPDGVIIHYDEDFVAAKDLAGITFVLECPCNGLAKYEDFVWNNRNVIRRYLQDRIEHEYELAEAERTFNKLANIPPSKRVDYDKY